MADEVTPDQRQRFETAGIALFEAIAARGGVPVDDELLSTHHSTVELLHSLGLLREESGSIRVVDPRSVQSQIVTPLGHQGAALISEASEWTNALSTLAQTYRRSPSTADGPVTRLHGDEIDDFLEEIVGGAQQELLTAQPRAGHTAEQLRAASGRDIALLDRGLTMRTIYQHASRRNRHTRQYVRRVTGRGAEVRTLDEFFNRLIVVDREVAVIPADDDLNTALVIREASLVAYLVDIFSRFWDRGRIFTSREPTKTSSIAREQHEMAIRMLIEGHGDTTCAKRLGVSPRTYASYIADLKQEFDAETRFQLGYHMGLRAAREGNPD